MGRECAIRPRFSSAACLVSLRVCAVLCFLQAAAEPVAHFFDIQCPLFGSPNFLSTLHLPLFLLIFPAQGDGSVLGRGRGGTAGPHHFSSGCLGETSLTE
ncbi:hypothetical protein GOODEAATRI_016828 [Goodea atripinnis]|uniref:Secreted protein n=1 Tax=Goodea atripinnis TaxID=208336 RepID=A0ABV0MIM4_9TELE